MSVYTHEKLWRLHLASWRMFHPKISQLCGLKCLRTSSATCQSSRSKRDLRPDWLFIPLKLSQSQMSKAALHWCKTGEWSYGKCSSDETRPTAELSNVKNGILRPQWLHPGSICLEGGWGRWLKSALREARCNQASKMRMTTSTLVDLGMPGCLSISRTSSREIIGATSVTLLWL